jgi:hypothetical protein
MYWCNDLNKRGVLSIDATLSTEYRVLPDTGTSSIMTAMTGRIQEFPGIHIQDYALGIFSTRVPMFVATEAQMTKQLCRIWIQSQQIRN